MSHYWRLSLIGLALIVTGFTNQAEAPGKAFVVDSAWVPLHVSDDSAGETLHFRNGKQLTLDLHRMAFLGQLPRPGRAPLLILGGWGCSDCDIEAQVYAIAADAGRYAFGQRGEYYYPGSLAPGEKESNAPDFWRGRMFIGHCMPHAQPSVVWVETERDTAGAWHSNAYQLVVTGDSAVGAFLKPMPSLNEILRAVKASQCYEVPGKHQLQF